MKRLALISIVAGLVTPFTSAYFTVLNVREHATKIWLLWALLLVFELTVGWFLLFTESQSITFIHKATLSILILLALVWFISVIPNPDRAYIYNWALKTSSYSFPYFAGVLIYYRERKT